MSKPYSQPGEKGTDTNQASEYQGNEPTYRVDKEKGKYVIRKFVRFDHSWAEYSPPIATYESEAEAEVAVEALYGKESSDD